MSVDATSAQSITRWRSDRTFFLAMALAIAVTVVVGFGWSFFRTDIATQLQSTWVKAHAVTFGAWILLYVCQNVLVTKRRVDLHRRLGIAGAAIAASMILLAIGSAVSGFWKSAPRPPIDHFMVHVVVHVDMLLFAPFVVAGLLLRNRPETHKRLMLLATISLLDAVTVRLPLVGRLADYGARYVIVDMFVVSAIIYDLVSRGRANPVYLWGGLAILVGPPAVWIIFVTTTPHLIGIGEM